MEIRARSQQVVEIVADGLRGGADRRVALVKWILPRRARQSGVVAGRSEHSGRNSAARLKCGADVRGQNNVQAGGEAWGDLLAGIDNERIAGLGWQCAGRADHIAYALARRRLGGADPGAVVRIKEGRRGVAGRDGGNRAREILEVRSR